MRTIITGRSVEVTEALKDKVEKKFGKLDKFVDENAQLKVTLKVEKNDHIVEAFLAINGETFKAVEKSDDMYASIDKAVDVMESQLIKNKKRSETILRDNASKIKENIANMEATRNENMISNYKKYSIKPMSVEEAILTMNSIDKDFFIFNNSETGKANLIYKMKRGGYGLIEPEQ